MKLTEAWPRRSLTTFTLMPAASRCEAWVIRLHDLRHTHASHLLAAGINVKVVSERLGHASVSFTLDTYGGVMPGQQAEAAAAAAGLLVIK